MPTSETPPEISTLVASEPAASAALALPSGKLMKRADVARRLGLSQSSVRRMEGTVLQPIVGPNRVRYFVEEHVEAVFIRIRHTQSVEQTDIPGPLAAQVFERFRSGLNAVDIVKELRIDPELVEQLATDWQRFTSTMLLRDTEVKEVQRALRAKAITDSPSLLAAIADHKRGAIDHCTRCENARASYCLECARAVGRRDLRREAANRLF
jgi:hypothetical protein